MELQSLKNDVVDVDVVGVDLILAFAGDLVEVEVNGEFFGVVHRDEDEGEVSYALMISILEEDLPPAEPTQHH